MKNQIESLIILKNMEGNLKRMFELEYPDYINKVNSRYNSSTLYVLIDAIQCLFDNPKKYSKEPGTYETITKLINDVLKKTIIW